MGAIIGALIGRKYAEKINNDKMAAAHTWRTIQDGLFNPDTTVPPELLDHALDDFEKRTVGKADKEKFDQFRDLAKQHSMSYQKARQAPPEQPASAPNPNAMSAAAGPSPNGGITTPNVANSPPTGMMPQAQPQAQQTMFGQAGLPAPIPAQKKTTDVALPAPDQSLQPNSQAPPPVSGQPSPGFNTVAPVNTPSDLPFRDIQPGDVPPPNAYQVSASEIGRRKAAMALPTREAELRAQYGEMSKAQIALLNAKWDQAQQFLKQMQATAPNSGVHYAVKLGANGPEVSEDSGTPLPRVYLGSSLPKGIQIEGDEAVDPKQTYTILRFKDGTRTATPVATPQVTGFDVNGNPVQFNRYVPGSAEQGGVVAPSLVAPKTFTGPQGNVFLQSPGQAAAGAPPVQIPGAVNPSFAPTTSTLNIPGQLPQTTTKVKGTVGRNASLPAPNAAIPTNPAAKAAVAAAADNSPIAVNYRNWVAGKATLSDKEQTAARQYAASHGLPTPNILDATAQKSIAAINPILEEIVHARQLLKDSGLLDKSETESKLEMTKAFLKYKAGFTDPLTKAISDLSFDRIRSVGQALQGTGSRALPIFNLGLEHTPKIGLNSDSGKMMDNKLEGMERRARESIAAAMSENKSGVAPLGAPGITPPAAAMPQGVPQPGEQFGGGRVLKVERVQ